MTSALTYSSLYESRCYQKEGSLVPHFWTPQPLKQSDLNLFATDSLPCQEEWGVRQAIEKVIALALQLEMPVGEWVGAFTRSEESRISGVAKKLLQTNIKDETFHYKGFKLAEEAFPISPKIMAESILVGEAWLQDSSHTIAKACFAETGVFLVTLAILRLAGGKELANLAEQVARDEARHVATNRGILVDLSLSPTTPPASLTRLIDETLDWVTEGLDIPGEELCEDFAFNREFLMQSSKELLSEGVASQLNSLMDYVTHVLPFEVDNRAQYTRALADA